MQAASGSRLLPNFGFGDAWVPYSFISCLAVHIRYLEAPENSFVFLILRLQSFGRIKFESLTLLFVVFENFPFNCCTLIELGPAGRADVHLSDGIPKVVFLTALSILAASVLVEFVSPILSLTGNSSILWRLSFIDCTAVSILCVCILLSLSILSRKSFSCSKKRSLDSNCTW